MKCWLCKEPVDALTTMLYYNSHICLKCWDEMYTIKGDK